MATSNNSKNQQVPPQVDKPTGPPIEYIGEGADKVKFTINPKAVKYVVHANGMVKEYL